MLFLCLYTAWNLLNGRITAEILLMGLPVSTIAYLLSLHVFHDSPRKDFARFRNLPLLLRYSLFLWKEVMRSALHVVRVIWKPGLPSSAISAFQPELRNRWQRMLLANSITLTPGTITVETDQNQFLVHCLEADAASGLNDSQMLQHIQGKEKGRP